MKNLAETRQFLEEKLVNKKNQNKEYVQTLISMLFILTIMAIPLYFEISYIERGLLAKNVAMILVALTVGPCMLAAMLIADKIQKKPFGRNPIITEQEIKNLAKETLEKSNTKLDELNQDVQNLKMLAI